MRALSTRAVVPPDDFPIVFLSLLPFLVSKQMEINSASVAPAFQCPEEKGIVRILKEGKTPHFYFSQLRQIPWAGCGFRSFVITPVHVLRRNSLAMPKMKNISKQGKNEQ